MQGRTPLCFASQYGLLDVVATLVSAGAAVDSSTLEGQSPLSVASEYGHNDVAALLLRAGARIDTACTVRNDDNI